MSRNKMERRNKHHRKDIVEFTNSPLFEVWLCKYFNGSAKWKTSYRVLFSDQNLSQFIYPHFKKKERNLLPGSPKISTESKIEWPCITI